MPAQRLLFVYNADSGVLNGLQDLVHKTLAPATYPCVLCAVTYGVAAMRPEWKQAIRALPLPTGFLHRDEFLKAYPAMQGQALPAAFSADSAGHLSPFISTEELKQLTLEELIALVQQRAGTLSS